jgi:4-hydroxy-tetrahydrodipicolinate reductase
MKILVLGRGKTGSLVADIARERGHLVESLGSKENEHAKALTSEKLRGCDVVVDFTNPRAVQENIQACVRERKNIVIGTTGWYGELDRIRQEVEQSGTGLLYAANFSLGVNIFFEIARAAAIALKFDYSGRVTESHHAQKKDAPSGTAIMIQRVIKDAANAELPITSIREGDIVGIHEIVLDSENDSIRLVHDAKSRRGFAEGAVRAAEWLAGKKGFYNFREIWRELGA